MAQKLLHRANIVGTSVGDRREPVPQGMTREFVVERAFNAFSEPPRRNVTPLTAREHKSADTVLTHVKREAWWARHMPHMPTFASHSDHPALTDWLEVRHSQAGCFLSLIHI